MEYIVIEKFNDEISLVHQDGEPFVSEDLEEANDLLSQLQGGYVLPLCDIINIAEVIVEQPEEMNASVEVIFEMKQILGL